MSNVELMKRWAKKKNRQIVVKVSTPISDYDTQRLMAAFNAVAVCLIDSDYVGVSEK